MAEKPPEVVVVEEVKKVIKKHRSGHHGGAWKVAYADFVTAMMALFIVLWIVGQSQKVKDAVADYFKNPAATQKVEHVKAPISPPEPHPTPKPVDEQDKQKLQSLEANIKRKIQEDKMLSKIADQIKLDFTDEGLRIQLVESAKGVFFDVGSAQIQPVTQKLLGLMAKEIGQLPNKVVVEGYTDSRPYGGQPHYSNWELSADRANAARRVLDTSGVGVNQIVRVIGYADRNLANPQNPLDASNRRISIIVRYLESSSVNPENMEKLKNFKVELQKKS